MGIFDRIDATCGGDSEVAHAMADAVLVKVLEIEAEIFWDEGLRTTWRVLSAIVKRYKEVHKWYA